MNDSNYHNYLKILGCSHESPTMENLCKLIQNHLSKIPFENISKLYYLNKFNTKSIPDFDTYLDGIMKYNFGGTCYSNNYYFHKLLKYLGYDVRLCSAEMENPESHMINIVEFSGKEYLVDVGYAAPFFDPIPLYKTKPYQVNFYDREYRFHSRDDSGRNKLEYFLGGKLTHGYLVRPEGKVLDNFDYTIAGSFKKDATFMTSTLLVKYSRASSCIMHNLTISDYENGKRVDTNLPDNKALIDTIEKRFGIPSVITEIALKNIKEFGDAWS